MFYVYFDSGTTNTRIYLIKDHRVVAYDKMSIGSKDSSIAGNNTVLIKGIKDLYDRVLKDNKLSDKDIAGIYASGMITSPFGIKEVPHIVVPVSLSKLYKQIYPYYESVFFNREIHLIRGVKTIPDDFIVDKYNVSAVNNMRGEEIEVFGMLTALPCEKRGKSIAVFLPGSHTHIVYIKDGMLQDILSTFYGELFYSISKDTILSTSIDYSIEELDEEMVLLGYKALMDYGVNRALYLINTMKIFNIQTKAEKTSFLEGVITGGVVTAFEKIIQEKWNSIDEIIIVGSKNMVGVYEVLLKRLNKKTNVSILAAPEKESFAVKGFLELIKLEESKCQEKY